MPRIYKGIPERNQQGGFIVMVVDGGDSHVLDPVPSQKLCNHSPNGFNWGYAGNGPAQLALALLLDITSDKDIALDNHQNFKFDVVAGWEMGKPWEYSENQIKEWLSRWHK